METHLFDRGAMENRNQSFMLNQDKEAGLKNSVNNGQVRLALEYAQSIIVDLISRVSELEGKLDSMAEGTTEKNSIETKKTTRSVKAPEKSGQVTTD
jgi:hypothetical protein